MIQTKDGLRRLLMPIDWVMIGYFAVVTGVVVASWNQMRRPELFMLCHAGVVAVVLAATWAHRRFDNAVTRLAHYWMCGLVIFVAFREIHYLVPAVRPWAGRPFDWALLALDEQLFGDVEALSRTLASRTAADVLAVFYALFYPLPVAFFVVLHVRGKWTEFRRATTVVFFGWFLSYLAYIVVPAQGPHLVTDGPRAPELDGVLCAKWLYDTLGRMELEMPDAFPSGHTLVTVLVLWMAWRYARDWFGWLLPVGIGIIAGTVYLRYHYVIDLVVGLLLVPISVWLGDLLVDGLEGAERTVPGP